MKDFEFKIGQILVSPLRRCIVVYIDKNSQWKHAYCRIIESFDPQIKVGDMVTLCEPDILLYKTFWPETIETVMVDGEEYV